MLPGVKTSFGRPRWLIHKPLHTLVTIKSSSRCWMCNHTGYEEVNLFLRTIITVWLHRFMSMPKVTCLLVCEWYFLLEHYLSEGQSNTEMYFSETSQDWFIVFLRSLAALARTFTENSPWKEADCIHLTNCNALSPPNETCKQWAPL
jgi:hypothetical protein